MQIVIFFENLTVLLIILFKKGY